MVTNFKELIQALEQGKVYEVVEHNFRPEMVNKKRFALERIGDKFSTINIEKEGQDNIKEIAANRFGIMVEDENNWKFDNGLCKRYEDGVHRYTIKFK